MAKLGGRGMFYESLVRSWFISPITQCPGVNAMVIHQHYHSLSLSLILLQQSLATYSNQNNIKVENISKAPDWQHVIVVINGEVYTDIFHVSPRVNTGQWQQ